MNAAAMEESLLKIARLPTQSHTLNTLAGLLLASERYFKINPFHTTPAFSFIYKRQKSLHIHFLKNTLSGKTFINILTYLTFDNAFK